MYPVLLCLFVERFVKYLDDLRRRIERFTVRFTLERKVLLHQCQTAQACARERPPVTLGIMLNLLSHRYKYNIQQYGLTSSAILLDQYIKVGSFTVGC